MSVHKIAKGNVTKRSGSASLYSTQSNSNMVNDVEAQSTVVQKIQLNPEPSDDPDDPLNWPLWLKIIILTQTSLLAAIGGLNTATINPAMLQLSREFGVGRVRASYQTTVCIALNGIAPWLWIPLADKYGRRPVYLGTTFLGFFSIFGCAYAQTYTELLIARIFNGLFPVGFALGATTVTDLFFFHQRGRAMGYFTVTVVNGAHMAPIIGGLLGQYSGWRWIFKFLAIVDAVLLIVAFFCLPETLYTRRPPTERETTTFTIGLTSTPGPQCMSSVNSSRSTLTKLQSPKPHTSQVTATITTLSDRAKQDSAPPTRTKLQIYLYRLRLYSPNANYQINYISTIMSTLRLFLSPTAVFPAMYYASMYGFASILPAVTVAAIFTEFFHWDTLHIGLSFGAALTIGGILGEFFAGWICDAVVKREQARLKDNDLQSHAEINIRPEIRLRPIWPGAVLTPIGLLIYGFTLQYHTHPALPLFGMGLSCFGLQIITTCTYTYTIDCHTMAKRPITNTLPGPENDNDININCQNHRRDPRPTDTTIHVDQPKLQHTAEMTNDAPPSSHHRVHDSSSHLTKAAHEPNAAQVAQLFNFIRQMFGFTFAFYVVHMGERIGYHWTFTIFAFCGGVLAFSPLVWLIFRGQKSLSLHV